MGRGKHVMLSYNWDHQDLVSEIYDRLTAEGIPCWMDIKGDMAGSINDAMADGAEKAALIVPFCTEKYQASKNCRRELMYADQEGVKIIPVLCDENRSYKPKAWLGIVIAGLLYFDFRKRDRFEKKLKELIFEIKRAAPHIVDESKASLTDTSDEEDNAPPKYEEKRKAQQKSDNVKFVYGNTYFKIPNPEMGNNGKSPIEHRWKLFLKIVEGNPNLIKKVTLDLGKYLNPKVNGEPGPGFERFSPNENNEYIVKMDSWGSIKQRPRKIHIEFKNGMKRTYEHTLHVDDGFMSCVLSLKSRNEPIEYVYGNTYEHIVDPKYVTVDEKPRALEHRWKLFLRILKGDPTYIKKVDINLGSNWQLRSQSAPDQENEFSTGYEISWGAIQSRERKIIIHFQDGTIKEIAHTLDISGNGYVSASRTFVPPEDTVEVMPFEMVQNCALALANDPDQLDFKLTLNGVAYTGILHKN